MVSASQTLKPTRQNTSVNNISNHHKYPLTYMLIMPEQAQSTNFREAFSLFDKRGNGRVVLRDLGDLLRACGQNPTLAEIKDLEKQIGGDCGYSCPAC